VDLRSCCALRVGCSREVARADLRHWSTGIVCDTELARQFSDALKNFWVRPLASHVVAMAEPHHRTAGTCRFGNEPFAQNSVQLEFMHWVWVKKTSRPGPGPGRGAVGVLQDGRVT